MDIYTSSRVMPYVYKLVHKQTGQFYFGSRTTKYQNKPSHLDLQEYQSSSDVISGIGFENFTWSINSEFFDRDEAYWHEQRLIKDHIKNPLCLNQHYIDPDTGKQKFVGTGWRRGMPKSEKHRASLSAANKGKGHPHTEETKARMSSQWLVVHPDGKEECITNMKQFCRDNGLSPGSMSEVAQGKKRHCKGYRCSKM